MHACQLLPTVCRRWRTLYIQMAAQATVSYLVVVWKMGMLLPLVSTLVQFWVGLAAFRSWKLAQTEVPSAALYLHQGCPHPRLSNRNLGRAPAALLVQNSGLRIPLYIGRWGEPVAGSITESR